MKGSDAMRLMTATGWFSGFRGGMLRCAGGRTTSVRVRFAGRGDILVFGADLSSRDTEKKFKSLETTEGFDIKVAKGKLTIPGENFFDPGIVDNGDTLNATEQH